MADYIGRFRTNYFRVKDDQAFRDWMHGFVDANAGAHFQTVMKAEKGVSTHMFGAETDLSDIRVPGCPEPNEDADGIPKELILGIQSHLMPGDACVIIEVGYERLAELHGGLTVITEHEIRKASLSQIARTMVRDMLADPGWDSVFMA